MDLPAYITAQNKEILDYIEKHYGKVPRLRGIRFMKTEELVEDPDNAEETLFNKYVGKDVIYIHTRCGGSKADKDSNYIYFEADKWEEKNKETFLENFTDIIDPTYQDHYFKAVIDKEYKAILKEITEEE